MLSIIQAAGWPIWPLILASIVALALILERALALRPIKVAPPGLLDEVIAICRPSLPGADIIQKLHGTSLLGQVLAAGLRSATMDPRTCEAALRQEFENSGREVAYQLERYLNALGTIATVAPLMGLFGTVVGMIEIFGSQSPGTAGSNPQVLAHGISVALYNTAFGLMVAIPALLFHRYFRARADSYRLQMELACERLLQHLLRILAKRAGAP